MTSLPPQLKQSFSALKAVRASDVWKKQNQAHLTAELNIREGASMRWHLALRQVFSLYISGLTQGMSWRSLGAIFLLCGFVLAPGLATVSAARGSLPGDTLYPVKRGIERARINVALSQNKKAKLEVGFVQNRLHELERITKEQKPSPERTQKVVLALEELKKDTTTVKGRLEGLKTEASANDLKIALLIKEKTDIYEEAIQATKATLKSEGDNEGQQDLSQALQSVAEVGIGALDVLVDNHRDGKSSLTDEHLKALVIKELDTARTTLVDLQERLTRLQSEETDPGTEAVDSESSDSQESQETNDDTDTENASDTEDNSTTNDAIDEVADEQAESQGENAEALKALQTQVEDSLADDIALIEQLLELQSFDEAVAQLVKAQKRAEQLSIDLSVIGFDQLKTNEATQTSDPKAAPTDAETETGGADVTETPAEAPSSETSEGEEST